MFGVHVVEGDIPRETTGMRPRHGPIAPVSPPKRGRGTDTWEPRRSSAPNDTIESSHRGDRPPSPLPPRLRVPRSSPPSAVVGRAAGTWWRRHGLACMRFSVSRVCRTSTRGNARRASAPRRRIRRDWPRRTSVIAVQPRSRLAFTARRRAGSSGLNSYPYAVPVGVVSTVVRLSRSVARTAGHASRVVARAAARETPTWI